MQVFAEDLGLEFNSFARESWKLVLLFILTELKRGFTHCLKEKAGIHHANAPSCSNQPTISPSVFGFPCNNSSTVVNRRDVRNDVSDDVIDDAADDTSDCMSYS